MKPYLLPLALLVLSGCTPLPRLGLAAGPVAGATPPLLPASQFPAPATTAPPSTALEQEAAALQARAGALRAP